MAAAARPPRIAELVLAAVFSGAGLVLLYVAALGEGRWPAWVTGILLLMFAGFAVIPEWRDPFGSGLSRIKVVLSWLSFDLGRDAGPGARASQPEKAPDAVLLRGRGLRAVIQEDLGARVLEGLRGVGDPLAYWSIAIALMEREDYGSAGLVLDAALERYPDHPKLLISAGYLWARQNEQSKAIQAAKRAIAGARDRDEYREQYYLAHANLCYYLAERGEPRDRAGALEAGRLASEHADEFANRDSFKINYGFAQVRFASSRDELVGGLAFLLELHRRTLSPQHRGEVNQYLQLGLGKLVGLDASAQELAAA